jgi:GNAT superfamily N-acetyltransferase
MNIRVYDPSTERPAMLACMAELQEVERAWDPALPPGDNIAAPYVDWILARCAMAAGRIFVAVENNTVAGFAAVLTRVTPGEPDEPPTPFAWMGELVVLPEARGRGAGRALLAAVEDAARAAGVKQLRTKMLTGNRAALDFYTAAGFSPREIELEKKL